MKNKIKKVLVFLGLFDLLKIAIRWARAIVVFLVQIKRHRNVTRDGLNYKLDLSRVVDLGIYLGGWEPMTIKFLKRVLKPGDVVVEAGANIGAHSLLIGKLVAPYGHCYAFEPTSYAYNKLLANIACNHSCNLLVTPEKHCLTNHQMEMPITQIKSSWSTDEKLPNSENISGSASAVSIDTYVLAKKIQRFDLLKIDVDGYDYKVLCGAAEAIRMYRPKIFIELAEFTLKEQNDSVQDILSFMHNLDYTGFYVDGKKILDYNEVLSISGPTSHIDAIFLPRELSQSDKRQILGVNCDIL